MKTHKDLLAVLKSNGMRITPGRKLLLQYILDNHSRQVSLREIHAFLEKRIPGLNRSVVYRNLETLKELDILQELSLPNLGKCFQYIFDAKVHHFYICKACGKSDRGNNELFKKIEKALKEVHGFSKANLSIVFYGYCKKCAKKLRSKNIKRHTAHSAL